MLLKINWLIFFLALACFAGAQASEKAESAKPGISLSKPLKVEPLQNKRKSQPSIEAGKPAAPVSAPGRAEKKVSEQVDSFYSVRSDQAALNQSEIWYNNYTEQRNSFLVNDGIVDKEENNRLNEIVSSSIRDAKGSFYSNYILLRQNRNNNNADNYMKLLEKQNIQPGLVAAEKAWIAERSNDNTGRDKAISDYNNAGMMSSLQLTAAGWMLGAVVDGSLIITNGEFDTYPLWYKAKGRNVYVISLSMIEDNNWLKKKLNQWDPLLSANNIQDRNQLFSVLLKSKKPVYISWSAGSELLKKNAAFLYPVGPLAQLSKTPVNNTDQLRRFYLGNGLKKLLDLEIPLSDPFIQTLSNLYPGLEMLKRSLQKSDPALNKIQELEQSLNRLTGKSIGK